MNLFGITVSMIVVWLAVALAMLVIEALTVGLTTIWFAAGALVALIAALLDLSIGVQIVVFWLCPSVCWCLHVRFSWKSLKPAPKRLMWMHS